MPLVLKKRIQVQPVGRRGIDRSICYVTGEITDAERRKLRGVLFPVASRVDALKTHAELLKMARQACADDTQGEFLDALDRRIRTKDWGPVFCKFAWEWHDTCVVGAGRRESEVESTKSIITLHLEPAFGELPLKSIDARLIDRYKAEKLASISQYKRPFSPKTINNQLGVLHRIFEKAIEYGHIEKNPVTNRSWMKTDRTAEDGRPWWRPDEERAVFLALEDWKAEDPHLYFAIKTQLVLGIRFSELRALTKDDLDLRTPGVWIRRAQARKAITTPKNKKARFHVLPRALADELRPWSLRTSGQLLFPAPSGIPLPNNVLNRAYSRLADKAHVRRITSHGARHTSGSSYAVLGAGQKMIATLLGHADMQSTERYTHVQVDATRAIVEARWRNLAKVD
jgi:integrase